jgi:tripartite ATP-independent transporter DctM subunit
MNYLLVLAVSLTVLLLFGVPIAFALALSATASILAIGNIDLMIVAQQLYAGLNSWLLLAIPFFLLAGELMTAGGMTERLLVFCNAVFGRFRGGLALSNVAAATFMSGISGSAVADTGALGKVLIPMMARSGYGRGFSAALTASANLVGPIIPPSTVFILIAVLTNLSPLRLFMAAVIPGLVYSFFIGALALYICRKRNYPVHERVGMREILRAVRHAIWALAMPLVLVGGIRLGVFNVVESSAFAVVYALFVGIVVHRQLTLGKILDALISSARTTSIIMIVLGGAQAVSWLLAYEHAPVAVANWMLTVAREPWVFLVILNVFLLLVGTFMETPPALVILCPVLYPVAAKFGIDPYHLSIVIALNLVIGLITPPVAICLSIATVIAKVRPSETMREVLPFLAVAILVVLIITFVPALSLWLPNLIGGM